MPSIGPRKGARGSVSHVLRSQFGLDGNAGVLRVVDSPVTAILTQRACVPTRYRTRRADRAPPSCPLDPIATTRQSAPLWRSEGGRWTSCAPIEAAAGEPHHNPERSKAV